MGETLKETMKMTVLEMRLPSTGKRPHRNVTAISVFTSGSSTPNSGNTMPR
ncbi:hypothetical protein D3C83_322240 [compost metagenome]